MNLKITRINKHNFHLSQHGSQSLRQIKPGSTVTCKTGVLWVTQTGDCEDHILYSGDHLVVSQRGKVVVEALSESDLNIF